MQLKFFIGVILLISIVLRSWSQSVTLMGYIKDDFTRKAVSDVIVTIMNEDSTVIADSLMNFALDNGTVWMMRDFPRKRQNIILRVTHPEYETTELAYQVKHFGRNTQITLPDILLVRKTMQTIRLDEVVVRPTKIKMLQRGDTIVYDATAFNLPEGSMLDDLVRELPGAELRPNGEIFVNGKKVDYLMLNSREFFRGNNQIMLHNLPYYTVKDIKVYNRTTDLSSFLGREVEDKEYVMDVQLKKAYREGYLGNVETGLGSHERYTGRTFALRFTDNSRLTLYGNVNNINNSSLPFGDGQWGGVSDTNGDRKQGMAGGELFFTTPDQSFRNTLKAHVKGIGADMASRTTTQSFLSDGNTVFSRSQNKSYSKETSVSVEDYWQVTKKWWVSGDVLFDHDNTHKDVSDSYASSLTDIMQSDTLSYRSSEQYRKGRDYKLALSIDAIRKLAWGDEIAFEARYRHASKKHELFSRNVILYNLGTNNPSYTTPLADYQHEYDKAKQQENHYTLKMRYTIPFINGPAVSLMYSPIHKRQTDHDNVFRLDRLQDWSMSANQPLCLLPSMADMLVSCIDFDNTYNYKDAETAHVLTLNIGWHKSTEKSTQRNIELNFPLTLIRERMEYERGMIDTIGCRNYTVLNPKLNYESLWKDERYRFHASTSYLISAVPMLQLMPFRDDRNPLIIREGNTNLKQSWIYSANTSLSMRISSFSQMLSFGASINIYGNQIANGFTFTPNTGVYTYRPENVNGNWDIRGDANYSISFGAEQCYKLGNKANASFLHSVDIASVEGVPQAMLSKVNTTFVNDELSFAYSKQDLGIEVLGSFTLRHTVSALDLFDPICATDFSYGMNARYTIPILKIALQTDLTMYSRRGYGSSEFNTDDLMWNVTLSRPFINGKLVVYADAMDILQNRRSTQYAISAQGRTITWQRSMPSYAMLRVQWRFNYNPKKK